MVINTDNIQKLIEIFFNILKLNPNIDDFVYNEFSLQHELGTFLRQQLGHKYHIQFERNIKKFYENSQTIKKEIDIVIFNDNEKYAIELKFPRNGQYPETMFSFIKDISFMEQAKSLGFTATFCICLVDDKNFYQGKNDGIYQYFRQPTKSIQGEIQKPTGDKDDKITVEKSHQIHWQELKEKYHYYILKI